MTDQRHAASKTSPSRALTPRHRPRFTLRPLALALVAGSLLSLPPGMTPARAQAAPGLPSGLSVIQGQVNAVTSGKQLTITNSSGSILNWQSFSIGAGNGVTFVQPNAQSQVLNRVVGNDPSSILGSLTSNGRVWLLNPNGVIFGQGARIDVAGLVTSTLNLNDVDWLNGLSSGRFAFSGDGSAAIVNQGELRSSLGGHIALLGGSVRNEGLIEAPGGQILLGAGKSIDLIDTASPNLRLRVTAPTGEALNLGTLAAAGGRIDVHAAVVNQKGVVRADSLSTNAAGEIVLTASQTLDLGAGSVTSASGTSGGKVTLDSGPAGTTLVHGDVVATGSAGSGGQVTVLGKNVGLVDQARVDASGSAGGGQVLVGGGERGQDPSVRNADGVYVGADASITADATGQGDGGRIVLWGNDATRAYGSFSARGGPAGGNGGFIETSGGWIDVNPARLDASATAGLAGTWLLDPYNITITDDAGLIGITLGGSAPNISFTGSANNATIPSGVIRGSLNAGNNVLISTGSGGSQSGDITVTNANLAVAPPTPVSLSLQAARNITVSGSTISSTAAPLSVTLTAGTSGNGQVDLRSPITTNGGDIAISATAADVPDSYFTPYAVQLFQAQLNAGTGRITVNGNVTSSAFATGVDMTLSQLNGQVVSITGTSTSSGSSSGTGIGLSSTTVTADFLTLQGSAQSSPFSAGVDASSSSLTATRSLTVTGTSSGTGVASAGGTVFAVTPVASDPSATLQITGTSTWTDFAAASYSNYGVDISGQYGGVLRTSNGATMSVLGSNAGGANPALRFTNGLSVDAVTGGAANFQGMGTGAAIGAVMNVGGPIQVFGDTVVINSGSSLRSDASGNALVVAGSSSANTGNFVNQSTGSAFNTPNGRWLVYGQDVSHVTTGGLPYDFKQYNARFGVANPVTPATGNGLLFALAPTITVSANPVSKTYDGTLAAGALGGVSYSGIQENNTPLGTLTGSFLNKDAGTNKPVAIDTTSVTFVDSLSKPVYGYQFASNVRGDILPKTLTLGGVSAADKVYDGNTTASVTVGSLNGLVGSETLTTLANGNFDTKDAGTGKTVTVNASIANGSNGGLAGNYLLSPASTTTTASITPKALTLGSLSAANKVYDGNTLANVSVGTLGGLVGSETLSISAIGNFDTKDVGTGKTVIVNLGLGNGSNGGLASNYTAPPSGVTTADITPKTVTASGVSAANKAYDGNTAATVTLGSLSGLVGSETLSNTVNGSFDTKDVGNGKTVTVGAVLGNGTNGGLASNYRLAPTGNTTANITPAALTITANDASKTYGTTLNFSGTEFTSSGLVPGETVGSVTLTSAGTVATASVAGGPYPIVPSNAAGGSFSATNYSIAYVNGRLTVNPTSLNAVLASIVGNPSKTYDGTDLATLSAANYSLSGFIGSDGATVNQTIGRYDSANAGSRTVTASLNGSNFAPTGSTDLNNYTLPTSASGSGTITPKTLTLNGLAANNKVYDGTVLATLSSPGTLSGLVGDQTLSLSNTGASFDTKDAGVGKTVTVTGIALANGSGLASNYGIAPTATTTADITPKTVTATGITAANKVYDGNTVASVTLAGLSGLVGSETLGTSANGNFDTKDVGTAKTVTVGAVLGNGANGGLASNYRLAPVATTTADITPKTVTVGATAANKVYDGNTVASVTLGAVSGLVGSETLSTSASGTFDTKDAGTGKTVTVNAGLGNGANGGLASNYRLAPVATTTADITPKTLSLSGIVAANKVYDGNTTASVTLGSLGGLVGSETLSVANASANFDTKDAGTGKTVTVAGINLANGANGGLASNYRLASSATTTADITPKTVTVGATAANKVYDGNTVASVTLGAVSGLVGSETLSTSASGTFDTKDAGTGKTVTVNAGLGNGANGGLASNYRLAPVATTTADITPKTLSLSGIVAANKVYDGNTTASVTLGSLGGLVGSETLSVANASANFDTKDAGTGKTVTVAGINLANGANGGLASNYRLASSATTTADITPKTVTVGATAANKVYDGNTVASVTLGAVSGLVGSETLSTSASGTFDTKDAGTGKTVTVNAGLGNGANGGLASNYRLAPVATTTADITPKTLSLSGIVAANKVYDGNTTASVTLGSLGGLVGSETLSVANASANFDTKDAGTGKTVTVAGINLANGANGGLASNYRLASSATTTADITPKTVTVGATAANKVYDGNTVASVTLGAVSGLVGSETLSTSASGTFDTKDAGTGKTVTVNAGLGNGANGGLASNYRLAPVATTTADITPKTLSLSGIVAANKVYDGNTTASVTLGSLGGLVGSETLSVANASANFDTKDAGTGKTVTVAGINLANGANGGLASNYRLASSATTTADITPRTLTIGTVSAADKVYDANTVAAVTVGGLGNLVGNETLATSASGNFDTQNVGSNKLVSIAVTLANGSNGGLASNYRLATPTPTARAAITPATLVYTANPANKLVGAPLPALSGSVGGFVAGETLASATSGNLAFVTPALSDSPAGQYAVNGSGLTAANYRFTQAAGNATALTVTGLAPGQVDEGSRSALSLTLATVETPPHWSSPSDGRVLDVFQVLRGDFLAQGSLFRSVPVAEMSQDALTTLLTARDHFKKSLFAEALGKLEQDPTLADVPACPSAKEAENGTCLITEDLKRQIRAEREGIQVANAPAPGPATAPSPAPAPAPSPSAARPAPSAAPAPVPSPSQAPAPQVAAIAAPAAATPSLLRRRVRSASLPQIVRKIAVVIGVDRYNDKTIPQLDNSVRDARSVAQLLEDTLGYDTIVLPNANKATVIRTLNRLAIEAGPKDSVVVYYAGHGDVVPATRLGYWQLSDSLATRPETWLSNADIARAIGQIGASQVALISDSCYSGSLVDERIQPVDPTTDPQALLTRKTVVVMSSGGNEPVFDSGKQGHSPFAFSLMKNLSQVATWQIGGNVFERVRFAVARELPQRPRYGTASAAGHQSGGDYLFEQRQLDVTP